MGKVERTGRERRRKSGEQMFSLPVVRSIQIKENISNGRDPRGGERNHLHLIRTKSLRTHRGESAGLGARGGGERGRVCKLDKAMFTASAEPFKITPCGDTPMTPQREGLSD